MINKIKVLQYDHLLIVTNINQLSINHMAKQRFISKYRANIRNKNIKIKKIEQILIIFINFWVIAPKKPYYLTKCTSYIWSSIIFCEAIL